tara:strand:- start:17933 stop:18304 length:372 start_codon:yes stop_codon:yes gene_type:complete
MEENNQNGISSAEMYRLEIAELTKEKYTLLKRIKELVDENNQLKWDNNEVETSRRMPFTTHVAILTKEKSTLLKRIKELVDENNQLKGQHWDEEETSRRMDIIGQNGNTGEHYEVVDEQNRNK